MNESPQMTPPADSRPDPVRAGEDALVRGARAGDRVARGRLVHLWTGRILAFCRGKIGDRQEAEDAAQEALLRAMQSLDRLDSDARFGNWLRRIALNICRDWHRRHHGQVRAWSSVTDGAIEESAIDARGQDRPDCERDEELRRLADAVAELPLVEQEVVHLFYFHKLTYDEMAVRLGVARSTVNARLTSARATLRRRLEDDR